MLFRSLPLLPAGQVIEGMDVAVSKMSLGQEVEATIPYPFAYGVQGYPPVVPPRATLIFRIELIRFASVSGLGGIDAQHCLMMHTQLREGMHPN